LPRHVVPVACITMGYPAVRHALTQKLPVEAMVHRETYHDYDENTVNRIYGEKESSEETRQILEENQLENLAQVFTQRRYTKKDNEYFAEVLANVIKKQGF
ncbi:MAG: NADPH-dependent oxidoreductase, partial [Bacteroidales bacterium]|nr:NADPH-dependent oxidoreductase [Bacteroidales bacterium]